MFDLKKITRKNVWDLVPYSSARDDFSGKAAIFLDANESPFNTGLNRYPHPRQPELKKKISELKNIPAGNIILGNGSDELLDLLFRAFCDPKKDNVITLPPTYGMYKVLANAHDVDVREVILNADFQPAVDKVLQKGDAYTKLIFVCSPNNPTGNHIELEKIESLLRSFHGIVVVDEAYIDFSEQPSALELLHKYQNLIVLQTFSKAWGRAAIRLGIGFASKSIMDILNKIKLPYNVSLLTQKEAEKALMERNSKEEAVSKIKEQRNFLREKMSELSFIKKIFPSDANFLLVRFKDAKAVYDFLVHEGIIVRDRSNQPLCEQCLRITVGTEEQNLVLIRALNHFK